MKTHLKTLLLLSSCVFLSTTVNAQWSTSGNSASGSEKLGTTNSQSLKIYTNDVLRMIIKSDGTIGINTQNTGEGYQLSVEGKARFREVVVNTATWSDFVFDDKYDLMDLRTLESRIKSEKHLPGIPTACEVEENGVNVGEMNKLLLQKVEELTLYIIDLNKRIEELEKENTIKE